MYLIKSTREMQWKYMETMKYIDYTRTNKYRFRDTKNLCFVGQTINISQDRMEIETEKDKEGKTKMINKREELKKTRCRGLRKKCCRMK